MQRKLSFERQFDQYVQDYERTNARLSFERKLRELYKTDPDQCVDKLEKLGYEVINTGYVCDHMYDEWYEECITLYVNHHESGRDITMFVVAVKGPKEEN